MDMTKLEPGPEKWTAKQLIEDLRCNHYESNVPGNAQPQGHLIRVSFIGAPTPLDSSCDDIDLRIIAADLMDTPEAKRHLVLDRNAIARALADLRDDCIAGEAAQANALYRFFSSRTAEKRDTP